MNTYEPTEVEGTDLEPRTRRALEEVLSVLHTDGTPIEAGDDPTMVMVVSGTSGHSHTVDVREGRCTCKDHQYRETDCKHRRRARIALGHEVVDTHTLAAVDVDENLGANAPGPVVATSDGGVEVLDDADADPWTGPFAEYDKYGELTGARYYRCRDCGVEVHEDIDREHVRHRDGCRHSDDGRQEPTRSEPADFGGGDSTGVQDL